MCLSADVSAVGGASVEDVHYLNHCSLRSVRLLYYCMGFFLLFDNELLCTCTCLSCPFVTAAISGRPQVSPSGVSLHMNRLPETAVCVCYPATPPRANSRLATI